MTKQTSYVAVIGDLVESRKLDAPSRRAVQAHLKSHFLALATDPAVGLASQPLMTLGDEFQALFTADTAGAGATMEAMTAIVELARPTAVRFGVGIGPLITPLEPLALGMDGPCFHRARAALRRAHDDDLLCQLDTGDRVADGLWGALAAYCLRVRTDWTDAQREAIVLYQEFGAWSKVADALGVTRGAVSLRQRAAGWPLYHHAWLTLHEALAARLTEADSP